MRIKNAILLVLIITPLFCCIKKIKRLEQQLADEKERATFYRECLLSDEISDPCRSWIMLERFGVEIDEAYAQES